MEQDNWGEIEEWVMKNGECGLWLLLVDLEGRLEKKPDARCVGSPSRESLSSCFSVSRTAQVPLRMKDQAP